MVQRIVTSIIGLVLFFAVFLGDQDVFCFAVGVVALASIFEIHNALFQSLLEDLDRLKALKIVKSVLFILGILSGAVLYCGVLFDVVVPFIMGILILYMIIGMFSYPHVLSFKIFSGGFMSMFIALFLGTLGKMRMIFGAETAFLVFIFAWITDTGAYFSGRFFGRHKLIEKVSPKKTVEGAIGGAFWTVLISLLYLYIIKANLPLLALAKVGYWQMAVLSFFASVMAQFGDLSASAFKRSCQVKDFGTILPGHGGIMDRFDSVIFISPIVLCFFEIVSRGL